MTSGFGSDSRRGSPAIMAVSASSPDWILLSNVTMASISMRRVGFSL
jgi:hypothetical protein